MDRRARETRSRIGEAFLRLGGMRTIDELKVGDLAREAGIARSTFYAHYQGLDDYMARSFADMLVHFARHDGAGRGSRDILPVRSILDHVAAAGGAVDTLARYRHFPAMLAAGEKALRRLAQDRLSRMRPDLDEANRRTIATFLSAGFLSLLRDWIEQGQAMETAELHRRYTAMESLITRKEFA